MVEAGQQEGVLESDEHKMIVSIAGWPFWAVLFAIIIILFILIGVIA